MSASGGREPVWSRDGDRIFFKNPDRELVAASLDGDGMLEVADRRVLFQLPVGASYNESRANYDLSEDGRSFLMARSVAADAVAPSQHMVLENFHTALRDLTR